MRAAWFLGRSAWRRRWAGLVGLGLLAGIVGGVVVGSLGGIRRSASAFDRLIEASHLAPFAVLSPGLTDLPADYGAALRDLPEVQSATATRKFVGRERVEKNWWSLSAFAADDPATPVMVDGRPPAADRPDEIIVSLNTARLYDLAVGSTITVDFYTIDEMLRIDADSWNQPLGPAPELQVVGVYRDPLDAARSGTGTSVRAGPAFITAYGGNSGIGGFDIALRRGADEDRFAAGVERINRGLGLAPGEGPMPDRWIAVAADSERQSQNVIALGLGAFAAVAALAGLVAHGQTLRRWCYPVEADQAPLVAMGATGADRRLAILLAALPHVLVAVPVTLLVAFAVSPLFPFGVIRDLEPDPGFRGDPVLFALGAIAVAVVVSAMTWLVASAVVRGPIRRRRAGAPTGVLSAVELAGAPVPATVGMRFVLRPGTARRALPVNTAIAAAVLAVAGITAATLFTSSLDRLLDEPARYGNAWDLSLELLSSPDGPAALDRLVADPDIVAIDTPTTLNPTITVAGQPTTATVLHTVKGSMQLQVGRGRPPTGPQEIAVGPKLLDRAGATIGDEIEVVGIDGRPARFTVVGTALTVSSESATYHSEAFFSREVSQEVIPWNAERGAFPMALIRFAPGVDKEAATAAIDEAYPFALMNESFPRPPSEITNVAQLDSLPRLLAGFLAFLGFAALVHALVVTVRSRRRDLGILRSLGFTRVQSAATIVAMTSTIVVIGVTIGVPLGLVVGASGWRLVAQQVYVATDSLMPLVWIAVAVAAALVVANLTALLPARAAARQAPIESLRVE